MRDVNVAASWGRGMVQSSDDCAIVGHKFSCRTFDTCAEKEDLWVVRDNYVAEKYCGHWEAGHGPLFSSANALEDSRDAGGTNRAQAGAWQDAGSLR